MSGLGFPDAALDFYEGLEADCSRAYWEANKPVYQQAVREPMLALLAELEDEFGPAKVFRPHRDVRFSKDKTPYKTHQGAVVQLGDAVGLYVQVSAAGLYVGGGWWTALPGQLARFREVVAGPAGATLEAALAPLAAGGFSVGGDRLATRPRGVDPEHPRLDLLRHRSLTVGRDHGAPPWLATPEVADRVAADWCAVLPVVRWLADAAGPADTPTSRA
ncbi:MAG: DUF2461 domain-containing protein [Motilibacteraceae bacterium]